MKILPDKVKLVDYFDVDHVEIRVDAMGKLWVNIDGACALRIGHATEYEIIDEREPEKVVA